MLAVTYTCENDGRKTIKKRAVCADRAEAIARAVTLRFSFDRVSIEIRPA